MRRTRDSRHSTSSLVRPNTRALFSCWFLRLWIREKNRKHCWECCRRGKTRKLENIMGKTRKKTMWGLKSAWYQRFWLAQTKFFPTPLRSLLFAAAAAQPENSETEENTMSETMLGGGATATESVQYINFIGYIFYIKACLFNRSRSTCHSHCWQRNETGIWDLCGIKKLFFAKRTPKGVEIKTKEEINFASNLITTIINI